MPNSDNERMLTALEDKYLQGHAMSFSDLRIAQQELTSENLRVASISCGAILRSKQAEPLVRRKAVARLEELCTTYRITEHPHRNEILVTLLLIPVDVLAANQRFRDFAYAAAEANRFTTRADAVLVLERLAQCGDTFSVGLLNIALNDSNEVVRRNARICLDRLGIE